MTEPVADIALSPDLDRDALRRVWAASGRVHIPGVLTPDSAERIALLQSAQDDLSAAGAVSVFDWTVGPSSVSVDLAPTDG